MGQDWEGLSHEGAGRATRPSDPRIRVQGAQAQMKNLKKKMAVSLLIVILLILGHFKGRRRAVGDGVDTSPTQDSVCAVEPIFAPKPIHDPFRVSYGVGVSSKP